METLEEGTCLGEGTEGRVLETAGEQFQDPEVLNLGQDMGEDALVVVIVSWPPTDLLQFVQSCSCTPCYEGGTTR
jgi:hypothetical protein